MEERRLKKIEREKELNLSVDDRMPQEHRLSRHFATRFPPILRLRLRSRQAVWNAATRLWLDSHTTWGISNWLQRRKDRRSDSWRMSREPHPWSLFLSGQDWARTEVQRVRRQVNEGTNCEVGSGERLTFCCALLLLLLQATWIGLFFFRQFRGSCHVVQHQVAAGRGVYHGTWQSGIPHGHGHITFLNVHPPTSPPRHWLM